MTQDARFEHGRVVRLEMRHNREDAHCRPMAMPSWATGTLDLTLRNVVVKAETIAVPLRRLHLARSGCVTLSLPWTAQLDETKIKAEAQKLGIGTLVLATCDVSSSTPSISELWP